MKKILLSGFFALIVLFTTAQCSILGGRTTQVGSPVFNGDNTTTYMFDLTFNLETNNGNKFFNLDMWQTSQFPVSLDSASKKITCFELASSLVNIAVDNTAAQPTLLTTFSGATCTPPVGVESAADGLTITKVNSGIFDTYTIQNVKLTIPTGSATTLQFYLWSTNSQSGNAIHCAFLTSLEPTGGPLPVTISAFNAIRNNKNVSLIWETLGEHNAKGFEIQRKSGNGSWQTVAFVNSKAPGGQSSLTLSYSYSEANSSNGATFYRLRQLDFDSHGRYSEIRSVRGDGQTGKTIVYPNPSVDGKVNVLFDEANTSRSILLVNMNGRTMQNWNNYTANSLRIENLVAGFYRLQINNKETGQQSVLKLVVAK